MYILKIVAFLVLLQGSLALERASLFCEYRSTVQVESGERVRPCIWYDPNASRRCSMWGYELAYGSAGFGSSSNYNSFDMFVTYMVECTDGTSERAGLCEYSGGNWYRRHSCDGTSEAIVTMVRDGARRRLGQGNGNGNGNGNGWGNGGEPPASINRKKPKQDYVDIDGEDWIVFDADFDF